MRHEIQFEIHCGVEYVIVQAPGSTAEDQGSPEASQAWSSHGPKTGLCDCREPIWGDGLGTEPPQCSQGLGTRPTPTTAKQCPEMSLCPHLCHCLGLFCQRIQLLGQIETGGRVPRCVLPRSSHCGHSLPSKQGFASGLGEDGGWEFFQLVAEIPVCLSLSGRMEVHPIKNQKGKI